jgi:hypothetical protein
MDKENSSTIHLLFLECLSISRFEVVKFLSRVIYKMPRIINTDVAATTVRQRIGTAVCDTLEEWLQDKFISLWGNISKKEVLYIFLYFLVDNYSYKQLERVCNIPHSNIKQNFGAIRSELLIWAKQQIAEENNTDSRVLASQENVVGNRLNKTTLIIDGTHVLTRKYTPADQNDSGLSYKNNYKPGVSILVAISHERIIRYVGSPYPANRHDKRILEAEAPEFARKLHLDAQQEEILADAGYVGANSIVALRGCKVVIPFKAPPNGQLSVNQLDFNDEITEMRRKVETVFGDIKLLFRAMGKTFRGHPKRLGEIFLICCAIHNWRIGNS